MLAACLVALAACGAPYDDAGYLGVADRLQPVFASQWDESAGRYKEGGGGVESTINASLLSVHAIAARRGYRGPSRQDRRARALVRSLLATPPYVAKLPPRVDASSQWHAPGWVSSMHNLRSGQHVMVDSEVVDGLASAWSARRELGSRGDSCGGSPGASMQSRGGGSGAGRRSGSTSSTGTRGSTAPTRS